MKRKLVWLLLLVSAFTLTIGAIFHFTHHIWAAGFIWAIGGVAGLIPALTWVIRSFIHRQMGSDILAVFSLVGTLLTNNMLASAIVSLMLSTGRVLESWAEGQAERQLKSLLARVPRIAHLLNPDGSLTDIAADAVIAGNRLVIKSGEIVPVDGEVITPALLDESALTGEPLPVSHAPSEIISSGVVNAAANFEMVATSVAADSTYAGIIRLVEKAQASSAPSVRLANKWALRFVPIALGLSLATLLISHSVARMVAVLVTATPCPLILAVPIAVVSGMSRAAKLGVVIKGGAVLELIANAEVVMLDKTGTLTHGGPAITAIHSAPFSSATEILQIAASIDQHSNHVIAKAILNEARAEGVALKPATNIFEEHGVAIHGEIKGEKFSVGQFSERPDWLTISYPLMVGVKSGELLIGVIGLADPIRAEAAEMMAALRDVNIKRILLVTGDRMESAKLVADEVGITDIFASVTAQGKLDLVAEAMQSSKGSVIFVGDGINDAPALAAATVGIAMGARGASAASESADAVIVEDSIQKLVHVIQVAKFARSKALQSAQVGMGLSLVAMIAASFGLLTSAVGAGTQEVIDVVAILWALTTLNFKVTSVKR